ncbi:MAG: DUF1992 domain-containing protein [Thermincola sp.]|jgi:hypothetical protein|nr:DUF1992 domain-containing protein [Thermincola sp.]MDT3703799.1 DUF1992 domain-containing protein [Thermincola sp.]
MEDIVATIAEQKIREAIRNGEFDNLPGQGKPLQLEDLSHVPGDLRAGYIILKNAGILPEEMQIEKEIMSLETLVNCCYDADKRKVLKKELNEKMLRFNIMMEKRSRRKRP